MRILLFLFLLPTLTHAQIAPQDLEQLRKYEQVLITLSYRIVNDTSQNERADACFKFIPTLVEALKVKGSFEYPFDSLNISILKPADNTFRIFTWQLRWGNGLFRQYGAIQMNFPDQLKLYPLFDNSDSLAAPETPVLGSETWYGAIYYNIYPFKLKGKSYYLLFGFDQNDLWSSKKLIDVLHFEKDKPVFGAPVFQFEDTLGNTTVKNRIILEYKKDAGVSLNYSEVEKMIIYDHLVAPEERLTDLKFTFIPDGTYEGFKLKKGKWLHIEKIKTININKNDSPPMPEPLYDK
ncbi:MAG: hypothetical protein SH857_02315 [Chitinophagales bacterium]|nr:hypothetical protein [Chitinophagales bacterium]